MSGNRTTLHPWLADHAILAGYRCITWGVTAMWLVGQGHVVQYSAALAGTLALTIVVAVLARHYIEFARHTPGIIGLDILLVVAAIVASGGWESPFIFYAYGALVLPALLFGWRGGIMAGLAFVAINLASLAAVGTSAADRIFEGMLPGLTVSLLMVAPPTFGGLFASAIERLRSYTDQHSANRSKFGESGGSQPTPREPRLDPPSFTRLPADERRTERLNPDPSLAMQLTRTRIVEPSVEELRRVMFAPLPAPDMDLGAIFDVLVTRFSQQTGTPARVSLIGRTRFVRNIHRDLLVRVAQEALLNVQQHAHAGAASLTLRYDINSVVLLIQDDGTGLADGTYERPGLHTLRTMHYRIAEFGGQLDVFETEGGGVTVRTTMPLE